MATMEPPEIIKKKKYEEKLAERVLEHNVRQDELYAFLGRLAHEELQAVRLPVKARTVESVGMTVVYLTTLDIDLRSAAQQQGKMIDGMFTPVAADPMNIIHRGIAAQVKEGYLANYNEGMGMPTIEAVLAHQIPKELQTA